MVSQSDTTGLFLLGIATLVVCQSTSTGTVSKLAGAFGLISSLVLPADLNDGLYGVFGFARWFLGEGEDGILMIAASANMGYNVLSLQLCRYSV
ncbi:hypothetical protein F5B18DRAFT_601342 [Nemania serpens]|nr:hypothetical protein F5B18DRAFT_601342 [Nemania serpens]